MKTMKKTMALLLALVFCMSLLSMATFAAPGDLTVDANVTVSGFVKGDTVKAYQFVTWDADNNNWKIAPGLKNADGDDLTIDMLKQDQVDKALLGALASQIGSMTEVTGAIDTAGTTWTKTCGTVDTAGSYLVLVTANDSEHIYNPAVVSADFNGTNKNAVNLTEDTANIKVQEVTVDKAVDNDPDDYDVQAGDIVPFTVTVTVPQYNTNWTSPTFEVKDKLSTGLKIKTLPTIAGLTSSDYSVDGEVGGDTFTITFSETYLKTHASTALEIKYSAEVGQEVIDAAQIHEETNTVTVKFSNDPINTDSHKTITDETHHYTFAIDASRFGNTSEKTGEFVKIGINDNGDPVEIYKEGATLRTGVSPLAGAEFTLTGVGPNGAGEYKQTKTTDSDGKINFTDLEVGIYKLKETKAPAGYVKDPAEHTVVISATYKDDGVLDTYSIKIDGNDIATYTATTDKDDPETIVTVTPGDNNSFPVNNTKGAELPSTGGIGTKIFYTMGAVLVVGAGVVLVSRKRAGE